MSRESTKALDAKTRETIKVAGIPASGLTEVEEIARQIVVVQALSGLPTTIYYVVVRMEMDTARPYYMPYEWFPAARGLLDTLIMGGGFATEGEAHAWMERTLPAYVHAADVPKMAIGRLGQVRVEGG